ncbi:hypothetical protein A2U01_0105234, partial [Trifolium medium]|nr:hypothetical protein [Trifolium medium]
MVGGRGVQNLNNRPKPMNPQVLKPKKLGWGCWNGSRVEGT